MYGPQQPCNLPFGSASERNVPISCAGRSTNGPSLSGLLSGVSPNLRADLSPALTTTHAAFILLLLLLLRDMVLRRPDPRKEEEAGKGGG